MSIPEDIKARLAALGVPVLLPSEMETPNKGAGKGQKPGIPGYLEREAPDGFVQIGSGISLGFSNWARYGYPVITLALTEECVIELSRQVFSALCGVPGRRPGPYPSPLFVNPPGETPPGVWSTTITIQAAPTGGAFI
jgi:hypothetical protein